MSRRHQGGRPHRANGIARQQAAPLAAPPTETQRPRPEPAGPPRPEAVLSVPIQVDAVEPAAPARQPEEPHSSSPVDSPPPSGAPALTDAPSATPFAAPAGCTAPQLRRFIKSRPYVPMHELRRRFGINGVEDEVSAVDLPDCRIFVGLPHREGALLGELLRAGDVGYELSLDPRTPIVIGLYPMRPIPRS